MAGKTLVLFKYPLEITASQEVELPLGSKYISIISQNDKPTIYVAVDPEAKGKESWGFEIRGFEIRGTGHAIDEGTFKFALFLGTVITHGGQLVWHVWRTK